MYAELQRKYAKVYRSNQKLQVEPTHPLASKLTHWGRRRRLGRVLHLQNLGKLSIATASGWTTQIPPFGQPTGFHQKESASHHFLCDFVIHSL